MVLICVIGSGSMLKDECLANLTCSPDSFSYGSSGYVINEVRKRGLESSFGCTVAFVAEATAGVAWTFGSSAAGSFDSNHYAEAVKKLVIAIGCSAWSR